MTFSTRFSTLLPHTRQKHGVVRLVVVEALICCCCCSCKSHKNYVVRHVEVTLATFSVPIASQCT